MPAAKTTAVTPKPKEPATLEEMKQLIEDETRSWIEKNTTRERVNQFVDTMLNNSRKEIVLKLLGFDNKWHAGWELDHCNGRAGNSTAGTMLASSLTDKVREWLTAMGNEVISDPPEVLMNNLKKEYRAEFAKRLESEVRRLASNRADQVAEEIFKEVTGCPANLRDLRKPHY